MIESLDFVAVPSTDWKRSRAFYVDTLGLRPDEHAEAEFWVGGHRRYAPREGGGS